MDGVFLVASRYPYSLLNSLFKIGNRFQLRSKHGSEEVERIKKNPPPYLKVLSHIFANNTRFKVWMIFSD